MLLYSPVYGFLVYVITRTSEGMIRII